MSTATVLGTSAFALGVLALGLALAKKEHRRQPSTLLLPVAIILGTLHSVVAVSASLDLLLTVASLLVAVAVLWILLRRGRSPRPPTAGVAA
jgi:uncharacterized membrane protein HdeD (DUF308 family)